jgi:hypothetical protein
MRGWSLPYDKLLGLVLIPAIFAIVQGWISFNIIFKLPPYGLADGALYIAQGGLILGAKLANWPLEITRYGLYPAFLSLFRLRTVNWATAGNSPALLPVYETQALLLASATAIFLCCTFAFISGTTLKRTTISVLLGFFLLSPLVIVWPGLVLTESLTLPTLLLLLAACLASDNEANHPVHFIVLTGALLVLVRDPLISFIWLFAILLAVNIAFVRSERAGARIVAVGLLLAVCAFGVERIALIGQSDKYIQPLANIVQLRVLTDPQRRAFFAAHGLPLSPAVLERSGHPAQYKNSLFLPDDDVSTDFLAYRKWLFKDGFKTYAAFLISNPGYLIHSVMTSPNVAHPGASPSADPEVFSRDFPFSFSDLFSVPRDSGYWMDLTPYPKPLNDFLLAPLGWPVSAIYLCYLGLTYVLQTIRKRRTSSLEVAALAAFAFMFQAYHADGLDLWRHCAPMLVAIYVSVLVRLPEIGVTLLTAARTCVRRVVPVKKSVAVPLNRILRRI